MATVYVRASRRAKAYVRAGRATTGKLRRTQVHGQDNRGTNYPAKLENHYKNVINFPRTSRREKRRGLKFLRTFRHGK